MGRRVQGRGPVAIGTVRSVAPGTGLVIESAAGRHDLCGFAQGVLGLGGRSGKEGARGGKADPCGQE